MEKSIETIWKEGFLKNDALVTPKLNDLYNRKSEHIVDKFTRMFKINLIAIVGGSVLFLALSYLVKIPYMGLGFFILLNTLAYLNLGLMKGLGKIDKNVNSYQYLKTFNRWLRDMISLNQTFARVLYPFVFLSLLAGFWFGPFGGSIPGDAVVNELLANFPETPLLYGFPLYLISAIIGIMVILAIAGGRIYRWDFNIVYGGVLNKLREILADMEDLRS